MILMMRRRKNNMKQLSRREFIVDSAFIAGGAFGTLALGSGVFAPKAAHAAKINFLETQCGMPENNGKKVLVGPSGRSYAREMPRWTCV
jgi:secreted PhoX family phosphatase